MESEEEEKYCSNCKRSVAASNFAIHSAFCERNIFVCKICKEPVGIAEKDEHFDNYHVISPCDLCEASIEKWMLPDHMEICPRRLIVCEYCEAEFPLNEHSEHIEFCGSRTEKCLLCKKYIMMKDKKKHSELHRCEEMYNRKRIEEEIKQNKVNEVISSLDSSTVKKTNSGDCLRREENRKRDPETRIGANFVGMEESRYNSDTSSGSKRREQDFRMQSSSQGATGLPVRAKEKSSRYGECHICKQSIPWIDMNTHVPSCASLAGKCSLCGEDVPNHAMKDHMRRHTSGNLQMQSIRAPESPVSFTSKNSPDCSPSNIAKVTKSSRYGECPFCKQSIPWIDMNTHVPSCASLAGKCSLCGEDVPNHAMKDHMRGHTSGNLQMQSIRVPESPVPCTRKNSSDCSPSNVAKVTPNFNDKHNTEGMRSSSNEYECPLCLDMVPRKDRQRHETSDCRMVQDNPASENFSRSPSQNFIECPMCSERFLEENWQTHLSFGCRSLLENRGPDDTSNTGSDYSVQCPLCLEWMPEENRNKHESFECKILIDAMGVDIPEPEQGTDSAKKTCQCSCRKKTNNCGKCKNNSQHKMPGNQKHCQQRKVSCNHCEEMIDSSNREVHEKYCPAQKFNKYSSKHERGDVRNVKVPTQKPKGAIPKNTNIKEMMRPVVGKCKYCHTTLNRDILKYHEDECVHRQVDCPECQTSIPIKDLDNHECRKMKKTDTKHTGGLQSPEEKTESGFSLKRMWNYMNPSSNKEKDEKKNTNRQDFSSYNPYSYLGQSWNPEESSQPLYFSDSNFMVPCEFCSKEVLSSELVLHETECRPDLLSYAKQEPSGNPDLSRSSAQQDSVTENCKLNKTNRESRGQPFFPENSNRIKHERKLNEKPGEFLQMNYEKSSPTSYGGTGKELKGKNKDNRSFQSVWNSEAYTDNGSEHHSEKNSKHSEDLMDVDEYNEPKTSSARTSKYGRKIRRQSSEDGDMNAFLSFLDEGRNKKPGFHAIESEGDDMLRPKFASHSAFDPELLKKQIQQKNCKDYSHEKNTNTKEDSSKSFKENLRSVAYSRNNRNEITEAIQQLKDSQSDASSAVTYNQIPIDAKTLEEKEKDLEISNKQKILLDASRNSNKGSVDDFKKYLPQLKFASPKSSIADGENSELCAKDDERHEKSTDKTSVYDRISSKVESASSLKDQTNFKLKMHQSSAPGYEKNVYKTMEDEDLEKRSYKNFTATVDYAEGSRDYIKDFKNCIQDSELTTNEKSDILQEYNRLVSEKNEENYDETQINYVANMTRPISPPRNDRKTASDSHNLTDFAIAHLKSKRFSLENTERENFLPRSVVDDEPVMPFHGKTVRDIASGNECISDYKKRFPDFKFATSQKSTTSKEDSVHRALLSEKNFVGASENLYKQLPGKTTERSDGLENEREYAKSFTPLENFRYANFESTTHCTNESHQQEKSDESNKTHLGITSTYFDKMSKNETECSNDFKKYLPDFKFGSQITRSSEDKIRFETESKAKWNQWRKTPTADSSESD